MGIIRKIKEFLGSFLVDKPIPEGKEFNELSNVEKNRIIEEVQKCSAKYGSGTDKRFDEARKKFPIGKKLVGKTYRTEKEIIVPLDEAPSLVNGSYQDRAIKIPAGVDIEILDYSQNRYLIRTKDNRKCYMPQEELDKELKKQLDYTHQPFEDCKKEVAKKYKISEETMSRIFEEYTGIKRK